MQSSKKKQNDTKTFVKLKREKEKLKATQKKYVENIKNVIEEYNHNGKKTIALFCDTYFPFIDGVINVMDNYAKRLKKNFNIIVCVPRHKDEYIEKEYPIMYFKSVYFDGASFGLGQPNGDMQFLRLFKQLHVDLVHIHSPFMVGRFGLKVARKRDIPIVATFHSQFKKDFKKIVKTATVTNFLLAYIMEVFNGVDEVWTMNEATQKTLESYKFTGKIRIISNATDFVMPENENAFASLALEKFGIKSNENIYCFVGRLIALKNIVLIAESLAVLKQKGIPFKMIYIGDGADRHLLEEAISRLGLENDVVLTGKIMDKALIGSVLYNSKIMLFPSIYDTDGIVKYEAAAFGTPTLFLKGSNASYDIVDNETGFICEGTPKIIAERLEKLYYNDAEIQRVGQNAKQKIFHHWDDVIEQVSNIYLELIKMSEKQLLTKKQIKRTAKKERKKEVVTNKLKKKIKNDLI